MSDKSITSVSLNVNIPDGHEAVLSTKQKSRNPYDFTMMGREDMMNSIGILANMKPQEARVFMMVVENLEYKTNKSDISMLRKGESSTEKVQFSQGYTRLKKLDVLLRIGFNVYMINPMFIIPPTKYVYDVIADWEFYYEKFMKPSAKNKIDT